MLTASSATGQLVFLPLAAWLVGISAGAMRSPSVIGLLVAGLLVALFMCDRPSVGLAPAACRPVEKYAAQARARWAAPSRWRRLDEQYVLGSVRAFYICGLSTSGLVRLISSRFAPITACQRSPASTLAMMGVFDFLERSCRAGCPVASATALCSVHGLRGLCCSTCLFIQLWSGAVRSASAMTGLRPFPDCPAQRAGLRQEKAGIAFGWIRGASAGRGDRAFGRGSRSLLLSYSGLFRGGAVCLVASAIVWLIAPIRGGLETMATAPLPRLSSEEVKSFSV